MKPNTSKEASLLPLVAGGRRVQRKRTRSRGRVNKSNSSIVLLVHQSEIKTNRALRWDVKTPDPIPTSICGIVLRHMYWDCSGDMVQARIDIDIHFLFSYLNFSVEKDDILGRPVTLWLGVSDSSPLCLFTCHVLVRGPMGRTHSLVYRSTRSRPKVLSSDLLGVERLGSIWLFGMVHWLGYGLGSSISLFL